MELIDPPTYGLPSGELTPLTIEYLRRSASWMRFLAILGFVMVVFILMGSIEIARQVSFGFVLTFFYLIFAAFIFFPNYYLYQSSQSIRQWVMSRDPRLLERAMIRQNQFWSYIGVIMIVYLIFVVLVVLLGGVTIMSLMHHFQHMRGVLNDNSVNT